jgi:SAM-dependent methyltransferase
LSEGHEPETQPSNGLSEVFLEDRVHIGCNYGKKRQSEGGHPPTIPIFEGSTSSMAHVIRNIPAAFNPGITHPLFLIRSNLHRAISDLAPSLKGRMMDFGCGLKPYRSMLDVDEYIGVDYQAEGETYEQSAVDVFYDGRSLPFPDGHFDSIFSSEVFEHIFNLSEILPELHRVLKPGGKILITCPFAFGEHEIPSDFARYTSFAMQHMLTSQGFRILEQRKTGGNVEVLTQLRIVYWNLHILSGLKDIPVVRSVARILFFGLNNLWALALSRILPFRQDLYLNNVVLAERI